MQEKKESEYKIVSDYQKLEKQVEKQIRNGNIKLPFGGFYQTGYLGHSIKAIVKEEKLVSLMVYSINEKTCDIAYIWHNPRLAVEYKKTNKISPSKFLLKSIAKKGITSFTTQYLTKTGRKMVLKLIKENVIIEKGLKRINPKPKFRKFLNKMPTEYKFKLVKRHPK